ncbi:MAG: tetratricopeptide repeat protein [Myxococcota bacterium]
MSWNAARLIGLTALLLSRPATAMPESEEDRLLVEQAWIATSELRLADASEALERIKPRWERDPDVQKTHALLAYQLGNYDEALKHASASLQARPGDPEVIELRTLFSSTATTTSSFVSKTSTNGRFQVSHKPGSSALLVPYALEAMQSADRMLSDLFGTHIEGPIRLEIYESPSVLASVSSLTEEAILRTGTIALCKWNRLMVTSPRALLRGYPWMDTIAHEYVHLILSHLSRDRAPVWFQEGVAKFLERTWRGEPPAARLDPAAEALLHAASRGDRLIAFSALHPSIALLPSQEDAALAFAQVATFIEGFYERHQSAGLREAVVRIAEGQDARQALAAVAKRSWHALERRWRERIRRFSDASPGRTPRLLPRRFRLNTAAADETSDIEVRRAARFVRIGDMLWSRSRPAAAAIEYEKALELAPSDPIVASRMARAAIAGGNPARAMRAAERVHSLYPEHAPSWSVLAQAQLALGRLTSARESAREAIRLNPFDPGPHCTLAESGSSPQERQREQQNCLRLRENAR